MKKRYVLSLAIVSLAVIMLLATPLLVFASSEEAAAPEGPLETVLASPIMPNLGEFIPMLLAVLLLVWIMSKMVWPPIMKALDEREEKIEGSLRSAEESKLEAENILAQYQVKLEEGRKEAANIVEEGRRAGEEAKLEIIEGANKEAADIIDRANHDAEAKEQAAAAQLQDKTAALAISIAQKILGEKLGAEDLAKAEKLVEIGG
ncbi:MAG: F0F1 ATP synthase subunit B [Coriobacteriia bacterium]|nr:F0F1 ATP synthase subunit B [Coriobacteriia bacterium]